MDDQGFYTPEHRAAFDRATTAVAAQDRIWASGSEAERQELARRILSHFRVVTDTIGREHLRYDGRLELNGHSRIVAPPGAGETLVVTTGEDYCTVYLENETPRLASVVRELGFHRFVLRLVTMMASAAGERSYGVWGDVRQNQIANVPLLFSYQPPGRAILLWEVTADGTVAHQASLTPQAGFQREPPLSG